jgi:hypothetical protein
MEVGQSGKAEVRLFGSENPVKERFRVDYDSPCWYDAKRPASPLVNVRDVQHQMRNHRGRAAAVGIAAGAAIGIGLAAISASNKEADPEEPFSPVAEASVDAAGYF